MSKTERQQIERMFLNATQAKFREKLRAILEAMTDEDLSDHYADAKQLAMVYRDNPQIRHLPPVEVMRLPIQKIEVVKKENGKVKPMGCKYIVAFQA